MARTTHLIDLSHTVEADMVTYPGLPGPTICDFMSREQSRERYAHGTEFQIGQIQMVGNTGTYLDSPFHRYADGKDLSQIPLESIADLDCVVIDASTCPDRGIEASLFSDVEVSRRAVLVRTDWARHWRTDAYLTGHPYLTQSAAEYLRDQGAALVGIDSLNIDCTDDGHRPAHTVLLGADIPIVEHMCNLDTVPARGARFFAVPVKVAGFGTFPVRAFAAVPG